MLWTAFPDFWEDLGQKERFRISGVADAVMSFNYSINFYIHFIANKDIRDEVIIKFSAVKQKICKLFFDILA